MPIPFDVFSTCDEDALMAQLRSGQSLLSDNLPMRLALNYQHKILCMISVANSDVCLGPFECNDNGLEEAVYDGLHYLESNGFLNKAYVRFEGEANTLGEHVGLGAALRSRRGMMAAGSKRPLVITPVVKSDIEIETLLAEKIKASVGKGSSV